MQSQNLEQNILKDSTPSTKYNMQFTDVVSIRGCQYIKSLSKPECKARYWNAKELDTDGEAYGWESYYKLMKAFVTKAVHHGSSQRFRVDPNDQDKLYITHRYKRAAGRRSGRIYVCGFGVQSLQNEVRKVLTGKYLDDCDQVNAHYHIAVKLCKQFNKRHAGDEDKQVSTKQLERYVRERKALLTQHGLKKIDLLVLLNSDRISEKRKKGYAHVTNDWARKLHAEKQEAFTTMAADEAFMHSFHASTGNALNPVSSLINVCLCHIENELTQSAIQSTIGGQYPAGQIVCVPMFDGYMFEKEHKATVNPLCETSEWTFKSNESGDPDFEEFAPSDSPTYDTLKAKFEQEYCKILEPSMYLHRTTTSDGRPVMNWIQSSQMVNHCRNLKGYPKIEIMVNEECVKRRFIDMWLDDDECLQYNGVCFMPYGEGQPDPTPAGWLNTFTGFDCHIDEEMYAVQVQPYERWEDIPETLAEEDWNTVLPYLHFLKYGLSDGDRPTFDFIHRFYAHKLQKPDVLMRTSLWLKGNTGVGKDKQIDFMSNMMGRRYVYRTENLAEVFPKSDSGGFNDVIESKLLVAFNETGGKSMSTSVQAMKDQTDREYNNIKKKFFPTIAQKNHIDLHGQSNQESLVVVEWNERRITLVVVGDYNKGDSVFWTRFCKWAENGGYALAYNYFCKVDLTDFKAERDRVKTDAYETLRANSIPAHILWLNEQHRKGMPGWTEHKGRYFLEATEIYKSYLKWAEKNGMLHDGAWTSKSMRTAFINMGITGGVKGWATELRVLNHMGQPTRRRCVRVDGELLTAALAKYDIQEAADDEIEDLTELAYDCDDVVED